MGYTAKYNGRCWKCSREVLAGDSISWSRHERGKVAHVDCAVAKDRKTVEAKKEQDGKPMKSNYCFYCGMVFTGIVQIEKVKDETSELYKGYHVECHKAMLEGRPGAAPVTPATNKTVEELPVQNNNKQGDALDLFVGAILPKIQDKLNAKMDKDAVNELIEEAIGKNRTPLKIEVTNVDTGVVKTIERPHAKLKQLLYYVSKRQHVYLYGPAGSGKSTAAQQVAEALNRSFGYISLNPQTPDSRILGFVDAGGTYRETEFYRCYKNGGVFCIDEMDNASAALLTTLNSLLENGHGAFPNGIIPRHAEFILVATGNTNGKGGNPMFPERRPFDSAFAERFTFLLWEYDEALEKDITLAINPKAATWLTWIRKVRAFCAKNYPRVLVSPRASFKGAEYLKDSGLPIAEIAEAVVWKGLDKDTVNRVITANPLPVVEG